MNDEGYKYKHSFVPKSRLEKKTLSLGGASDCYQPLFGIHVLQEDLEITYHGFRFPFWLTENRTKHLV